MPLTLSKPNQVATLNMLGMQPDFNVLDNESLYTVDQTVYQIRDGRNVYKTASAGDVSLIRNRYPMGIPMGVLSKHSPYIPGGGGSYGGGGAGYSGGMDSATLASSVGTQSLIENEFIPDPLPSMATSNVTMLDMGSITTLGESMGKSVGLFTSSNSKNLDISISNLVSPCLGPSGDLTSIEELSYSLREDEEDGGGDGLGNVLPSVVRTSAANSSGKEDTVKVKRDGSGARLRDNQYSPGREERNGGILELKDSHHSPSRENRGAATRYSPGRGSSGSASGLRDSRYSPDRHRKQNTDLLNVVQHKPENSFSLSELNRNADTRCSHYTHSTAPLQGGANMLGSQVYPSTVLRQSMLSSEGPSPPPPPQLPPPGKAPPPQVPDNPTTSPSPLQGESFRFEDWPSEIALIYTINMASIAIYGRTSLIQRQSLEGRVSDGGERAGLLELAGFEVRADMRTDEKINGKTNTTATIAPITLFIFIDFPSWSVRHAAVLGLSRVSKTCRSLPMKDGLSNVAWSRLVERHTAESDPRVLHAFNISQV